MRPQQLDPSNWVRTKPKGSWARDGYPIYPEANPADIGRPITGDHRRIVGGPGYQTPPRSRFPTDPLRPPPSPPPGVPFGEPVEIRNRPPALGRLYTRHYYEDHQRPMEHAGPQGSHYFARAAHGAR
jgi:hypothetical protein